MNKIIIEDWDELSNNNSNYDYGTIVKINDNKVITGTMRFNPDILKEILDYFKIDCEIEYLDHTEGWIK